MLDLLVGTRVNNAIFIEIEHIGQNFLNVYTINR